ncbi:MAG: hypothetical protein FJ395_09615 [Verrucomicrobia bacterium]|nr:hypothetical protein [Verrucomicrobiota bacterium]
MMDWQVTNLPHIGSLRLRNVTVSHPLLEFLWRDTVDSLQRMENCYVEAVLRGCDVDKPRNLAKSVTVE